MTDLPDQSSAKPAPTLPAWLWRPTWIVFVSSACTMVLELVAGRIIAPYVGVSLYTWTTVIGVVLAGISLGNYLGGDWPIVGRRHDCWPDLFAGGLSCFCIMAVDAFGSNLPGSWPVVVQILALTAALFLLPSAILGAFHLWSPSSPCKTWLERAARSAESMPPGLWAASSGRCLRYVLIAWFGTHAIVWGVAVVLIVLGLLFT